MQAGQQIDATQITNKVNGVGTNTFMPFAQLLQLPTMQASVNMGHPYGQEDGEEIHNAQNQQSEDPGEHAHICKGEQYNGSDGRVVHGSEQTTECAGYDYMFSH